MHIQYSIIDKMNVTKLRQFLWLAATVTGLLCLVLIRRSQPLIAAHETTRESADQPIEANKTSHSLNNLQILKSIYAAQTVERRSDIQKADQPIGIRVLALAPTINCPYPVRLGGTRDGKWLCSPWLMPNGPNCTLVSLGVAHLTTFDYAITQLLTQCHLYALDKEKKSESFLPKSDRVHFKHATLTATDTGASNEISLQELINEWQLTKVQVWKMDLEKYEYELLSVLLRRQNDNVQICQLQIEIHSSPKHTADARRQDFNDLMRLIFSSGFELFHFEPNYYCAGGECNEWAFIHRSCLAQHGLSELDVLYKPF